MDNTKEPAFPIVGLTSHFGLTKREFFAAHAPKVVPNWFDPQMPPLPNKPPYVMDIFGKNSSHPDKELFMLYYDDESEEWHNPDSITIPDQLKIDVIKAVKNIKEWSAADSLWYRTRQIETLIQWPIFWAEQILKKLNA